MKRTPQKLLVLRELAKGNKLTVLKALRKLRVYALSQRCTELRAEGWPIKSRMVNVGGKRVAEYSLTRRHA
jgi:hypothetical protein